MIYTHVSNRGGHGVRSPADTLWSPDAKRVMRKPYKTSGLSDNSHNRQEDNGSAVPYCGILCGKRHEKRVYQEII